MDQCTIHPETAPLPDEDPVAGCVSALSGGICAPSGPAEGPLTPPASANDGGGGGWWRGIMSTARSQSTNMMSFMRRDLTEFVSVVRDDTKDAVQKTAGAVRESVTRDTASAATSRLKGGLTRFLDSVTSAMTIPPDDSDEQPLVFREGAWEVAKSRREARILTLQSDRATYESAPDDAQFDSWRGAFDPEARKSDISELLVTSADVRANYTRLVPKNLLHREFWARYFFRLEGVEREEARWEALKERANRQEAVSSDWGDDWDEESAPPSEEIIIPGDHHEPNQNQKEEPQAPQAQEPQPPQPQEPQEQTQKADSAPPAAQPAQPSIEVTAAPVESKEESAAVDDLEPEFRLSERPDSVVVKHKDSPESSSESCVSTEKAESQPEPEKDLEDWEADLDLVVTAEEVEEAKKAARALREANELSDADNPGATDDHVKSKDDDEDWENWE